MKKNFQFKYTTNLPIGLYIDLSLVDIMTSFKIKICSSCKRVYAKKEDFLRSTSRWRVCSEENLWFNCSCGSTLVLIKGNYPWYNLKTKLGEKNAGIFHELQKRNKLPHIKEKLMIIQGMLENYDIDMRLIEKQLKSEPLLALKIIDLANHLRKEPIAQYKAKEGQLLDAIVFLGPHKIESVLLIAFIQSIKVQTKVFNPSDFWKQAQYTAWISELLSYKYHKYDPFEAYTAGFLANIGKIIAAYYYPDQVDIIQSDINTPQKKMTWLESEKKRNFYDHRVLGEIAAAFWGLPEAASMAIQSHHTYQLKRVSKFIQPCDIVALANQLAHWVLLHPEQIDHRHLNFLLQKFDLNEKKTSQLVGEITQKYSLNDKFLKKISN
ncbi:MAG: HDOD domain-containing protein [Bdellovibrionota bacterium]